VSEDEKHRPSFLQRFLVTAACPVALVLVAARGSLEDLSAPFLLAALVFGYIAAALTKTWFASIVGSMLAGVALVVLFVVLFDAACSNSNGDCL
jgi:branched-subunit amino acid transport protein